MVFIGGARQVRIPTIPATQSERRRPRVGAERIDSLYLLLRSCRCLNQMLPRKECNDV
jgi:hypothetical protein